LQFNTSKFERTHKQMVSRDAFKKIILQRAYDILQKKKVHTIC